MASHEVASIICQALNNGYHGGNGDNGDDGYAAHTLPIKTQFYFHVTKASQRLSGDVQGAIHNAIAAKVAPASRCPPRHRHVFLHIFLSYISILTIETLQ
jgi:hypothetical protein